MAKIRGETRVKTLDAEQEIATLVAREERMRLTLTAGRIHTWDWNIATDVIFWIRGADVRHQLSMSMD